MSTIGTNPMVKTSAQTIANVTRRPRTTRGEIWLNENMGKGYFDR